MLDKRQAVEEGIEKLKAMPGSEKLAEDIEDRIRPARYLLGIAGWLRGRKDKSGGVNRG